MNIIFVETSTDAHELLDNLSKSCRNNKNNLILSTTIKNNKIYEKLNLQTIHHKSKNYFCNYTEKKAYYFEKRSRAFGCSIGKFSKEEVINELKSNKISLVLSYVGPEGIKYLYRKCCHELNIKFIFLDRTKDGYAIPSDVYSISGDVLNSQINEKDESNYVSILDRKRKKNHTSNILNYYNSGILRLFESMLNLINLKLKLLFIHFLMKISPKCNFDNKDNKLNMLIAPQSSTEAAYAYGSRSYKYPFVQLTEYYKTLKDTFNAFIRFHPISKSRTTWKELLFIFKEKVPIAQQDQTLSEALEKSDIVLTINSNIIYESILHGVPSIALGRSKYTKYRFCESHQSLSKDKILTLINTIKSSNPNDFKYSSFGLGYKSWNLCAFNEFFERFNSDWRTIEKH